MNHRIPLEAAAIEVADEASNLPLIFQIPPCQGRERLNAAQGSPLFSISTVVDGCLETCTPTIN